MKKILVATLFLLQLLAPDASSSLSEKSENSFIRHKVKAGETLALIGKIYGTTGRELVRLNQISSPIFLGQELFISPNFRWVNVSWYGREFNGKRTASGEIFHEKNFVVAHKKLPLGTVVEFFNPENQKRVIVRVIDRGPYVKGREFDLAKAVAEYLNVDERGVARLAFRVLKTPPA